jgi:endonuclease G, mitochondrial
LPQRPDLNQGLWLSFEKYCNDLVWNEDKELFIFAGGIFHSTTTIGNGVAVPDSCFKIIVVLDRGQGLNNVTTSTPVIALVMPNVQGIRNDDWNAYRTTVRRIESSTGYNFLSAVPNDAQEALETK